MSKKPSPDLEKRIIILASGSGTNARNIIQYFKQRPLARVVLVLSNRKSAAVLEKATSEGVEAVSFSREDLYETDRVKKLVDAAKPDMIVLAGFLLKFPQSLLQTYNGKVVNIHPALLPKYGGKGMYGEHVHKAVIANGEEKSGITIHYVNEHYDEGAIIFQKSLELNPGETAESLAGRIHELEHAYFPLVLEKLLTTGVDDLSLPIDLDLDHG